MMNIKKDPLSLNIISDTQDFRKDDIIKEHIINNFRMLLSAIGLKLNSPEEKELVIIGKESPILWNNFLANGALFAETLLRACELFDYLGLEKSANVFRNFIAESSLENKAEGEYGAITPQIISAFGNAYGNGPEYSTAAKVAQNGAFIPPTSLSVLKASKASSTLIAASTATTSSSKSLSEGGDKFYDFITGKTQGISTFGSKFDNNHVNTSFKLFLESVRKAPEEGYTKINSIGGNKYNSKVYSKETTYHHSWVPKEVSNYLPWVFPSLEGGRNDNAPVLTKNDIDILKDNPAVKEYLTKNFRTFLEFLGLQLNSPDEKSLQILGKSEPVLWNGWLEIDKQYILKSISRALTCMDNFGLEGESNAFREFISQERSRDKEQDGFKPLSFHALDSSTEHWKVPLDSKTKEDLSVSTPSASITIGSNSFSPKNMSQTSASSGKFI